MRKLLLQLFVLIAMPIVVASVATQLPQEDAPILKLDPGGHTGIVTKVLFTPDGSELVSLGADKVIRFWDTSTGEPTRTVHTQIGPGNEGDLRAAAISPDGKTLAVAGYGFPRKSELNLITLIEAKTGKVIRLLTGHRHIITALAFSPDGTALASGGWDAAIVWNVRTGAIESVVNHKEVTSVAFSPEGRRLATASDDTTVRVWNVVTGVNEFVLTGHEGGATSVVWSPDGNTIATAAKVYTIRLFDANTGRVQVALPTQPNFVTRLAFSPNGKWLASGTGVGRGELAVKVWSVSDGRWALSFLRHDNTIHSIAFSPNSQFVASAGGNASDIFLWNRESGGVMHHLASKGMPASAVGWSPSGTHIAWGWGSVNQLVRTFDLIGGMPGNNASPSDTWQRAIFKHAGNELRLEDLNVLTVREGANVVGRMRTSSNITCFTFTPTGEVVVGTQDNLGLYSSSGDLIQWFEGYTSGLVYAVSVRGKYLAAACSDQTIRIWRLGNAGKPGHEREQPLLSLFMTTDREWVAWTPDGYYACSAKGERLIGWHVNRGVEQAADFYPAYQFRRKFYRPDVFARLMEAGSVSEAVRLADAERGIKTDPRLLAERIEQITPPKIEILAPTDNSITDKLQAQLRARIVDPNNRKIASFTLLVNGRRMAGAKDVLSPTLLGGELEQPLTLTPGENVISVFAVNDAGIESVPVSVKVFYRPTIEDNSKPVLYVLAIGVSKYKEAGRSLMYAAKDAKDFVSVCRAQEGKLYRRVVCRNLTDEGATRQEIEEGLEWLSKEMTQRDYAFVFVSGHGETDNISQYYFAPHDFDTNRMKSTGVVWTTFKTTLVTLPGKVVLLLDTCHSARVTGGTQRGGIAEAYNEVLRESANSDFGLVTFASCMAREVSLEHQDWNNGAFTKAVVEALQGKADSNRDGVITIVEVDAYIAERVKEITGGRQHPTTQRPTTIRSSLPLASVK